MTDSIDIQHKWIEERFNHVNTVLGHIRETVDHLRETQIEFMNRLSTQMADMLARIRETERKQAIETGHKENRKHAQDSQNLRWQMIIAFGTAISGVAAFIGYFMGKGQ